MYGLENAYREPHDDKVLEELKELKALIEALRKQIEAMGKKK